MGDYAYVAADVDNGWGVSLCKRNVPGHRPLQDYSGPYAVETAERIARRLNELQGLDEAEAKVIILSTMPGAVVSEEV